LYIKRKEKKMSPSQVILLIITLVGGICVLLSYYICFFKLFKPQNYVHHDMWLDMPESYRYTAIVFQILAIVGFFRLFIFLMTHFPTDGILSYFHSHFTWCIMLLFLIPSIIWPISVYYKQKIISCTCLIIVAIACILFLAGSVETKAPLDVMLGAFFLSIVCVLQDAVMWNATYLLYNK
jgi:hypothetical protein